MQNRQKKNIIIVEKNEWHRVVTILWQIKFEILETNKNLITLNVILSIFKNAKKYYRRLKNEFTTIKHEYENLIKKLNLNFSHRIVEQKKHVLRMNDAINDTTIIFEIKNIIEKIKRETNLAKSL